MFGYDCLNVVLSGAEYPELRCYVDFDRTGDYSVEIQGFNIYTNDLALQLADLADWEVSEVNLGDCDGAPSIRWFLTAILHECAECGYDDFKSEEALISAFVRDYDGNYEGTHFVRDLVDTLKSLVSNAFNYILAYGDKDKESVSEARKGMDVLVNWSFDQMREKHGAEFLRHYDSFTE